MFARALLGSLAPTPLALACALALALALACAPPAPLGDDDDGGDDVEPVAPAVEPDDLVDILEPIRSAHDLPALAALMLKDGAIVGEGATGVRTVDQPDAIETTDRWHLGSCTKAMTATLAAMLIDDGVLSWDATVDVAFAGDDASVDANIDAGYVGVTIEDLLGNRGGVPEQMTDAQYNAFWDTSLAPEEHRARFAREVLAAEPGGERGTFAYSNSGFMIAGAMLEQATGTSWEELTRTRLFEPLGMTSCGFGAPATVGTVDAPFGHYVDVDGSTVAVLPGLFADNPPAMGPAGTVHCSLADWAKFIQLHIDGARGVESNSALVSADAFAHLHAPGDADYALGWDVLFRDWGGTVLTHSGSNTMFNVTVWVAPEHNAAMFAATNRGDDDAFFALDEVFGPLIDGYLSE